MLQCYDIIIPVYNAYEELIECIESIENNTDMEYRVILIEDCSPDHRIKEYLKTIENNENIVVMYNDKNLGFVKSINRGMSYSENDVILLNSDTILTPGWLKKMHECAYSSADIGTVTPFTNNGTICSVPEFGVDNAIPEGFTIHTFANFIEKTSLKRYPVIPTAVGFCMLIKRKVIHDIGLFDDVTYGKGYGEENDFCCRAMEHGYLHVLDDSTFIYHKGSMSFKEEKKELIKKNSMELARKFPYYFSGIEQFLHSNPIVPILEYINKRMKTFSSEKKILYILHNTVDENWLQKRGGTEHHILDLIEELNDDFAYYTLVTNGKRVLLKEFYKKNVTEYNFYLDYEIENHTFSHQGYKKLLENILNSFEIDLVHIHHFQKHTFDVPYVCKELNVPVVLTVHDFHLICPSVLLIDTEGQYCLDIKTEEKCMSCLKSKMGYGTNFKKTWSEKVAQMLPLFDLIIFPSKSAKINFEKEYSLSNIPWKIVEHGIAFNQTTPQPVSDGKFKIAFIGTFAQHKGSSYIVDVINNDKENNGNRSWYLLGEIHDPILENLKNPHLYKLGSYNRETIVEMLRELQVDLVCFLSICPETFSYTLSESWAAGVPVLANNRGAFSTRIQHGINGWLIDTEDGLTVLNKIKEIQQNKHELAKVKEAVNSQKIITVNDMAKIYKDEIYNTLISDKRIKFTKDNEFVYHAMNAVNINNMHLEIEIRNRDAQLQMIYNTIGWRFLNYLRKNSFVQLYGKKFLLKLLSIKNRM